MMWQECPYDSTSLRVFSTCDEWVSDETRICRQTRFHVASAHVLTVSVVWHGFRYDSSEKVHCVFSTCVDWVSDATTMSLWLIQTPCDFSTCVDSVSGVTEISLLNKSPCFYSTCVDSLSGVTGMSLPNLWKSIVSSLYVLSASVMWQGCRYSANLIPLCLLYMWWSIWVSDVTRMSLPNADSLWLQYMMDVAMTQLTVHCVFRTGMSLPSYTSTCLQCMWWLSDVTGMLLRNPTQIPCGFSKCVDSVSGVTGISLPNLWESIVSSMHVLIDWVCYVTGITLHLRVCVSSVLVWVSDECHFPTSVQYVSSVHVLTEYDVKERE